MIELQFGSLVYIKDGVFIKHTTLRYYSVGVRGVVKCEVFEKLEDAIAYANTVVVPEVAETLEGTPKYNDEFVVNIRNFTCTELTIVGPFRLFDEAELWIAENTTEDQDVCSIKKIRTVGPLRNGVQS